MRVLFVTAPWQFQELYPPQMAGRVKITWCCNSRADSIDEATVKLMLKLTPFPGLAISDGLEKKGKITGKWAPNMIPFIPHTMTEDELTKWSAEAIRRFYMRPGYLIRRGLRMRSWHDVERNVRGFFSFFGLQGEDYRNGPAAAEMA